MNGSSFAPYHQMRTMRGTRVSDAVITGHAARTVPGARVARRHAAAALLLAPSALFLIAFTYWPVARVLAGSFTVGGFGVAPHAGLSNYARLFADPRFAHAELNNLLYAAGTIPVSLALALGLALALNGGGRLAGVLRTIIALPLLIPLVAAASLFIFIFLPGAGLLDHYLGALGLAETNWLGDPSLALASIVLITIWKNTGYYMLFFLAGLAGMPRELVEAAKIDGAGAVRRFVFVTLPLLGPTLAFVVIIALLNVITQVDHVIVMTQGGPSDATLLVLYYIYEQAHQNNDLGLASAATVVSVAFLFALSMLSLRGLERGIHYES